VQQHSVGLCIEEHHHSRCFLKSHGCVDEQLTEGHPERFIEREVTTARELDLANVGHTVVAPLNVYPVLPTGLATSVSATPSVPIPRSVTRMRN
jgi:hypothetical protein